MNQPLTPRKALESALQRMKSAFSQGSASRYHAFFVAFVLVLAVIPLVGASNLRKIDNDFLGRKAMIRAVSEFRYRVLKDSVIRNAVISGKWLIYSTAGNLDDYQKARPFKPRELNDIQSRIAGLGERLNARGIKLYITLAPNKETIYPEIVPSWIPVLGDTTRYDQIMSLQDTVKNVRFIDLRPALLQAKQSERVYYYTDTHWNQLGAFVAYKEIIEAVRQDFPQIQPMTLDAFTVVNQPGYLGDIAGNEASLNITEDHSVLEPRMKSQVTYREFKKNGELLSFYTLTSRPDSGLPQLVMYRDSFSSPVIPFLSEHFSRGVYLWDGPYDESYYVSEDPEAVILMYTERNANLFKNIPPASK